MIRVLGGGLVIGAARRVVPCVRDVLRYFRQEIDMNREIVLPAWLSVLSLAVALFVPLGVTLIADTSMDLGRTNAERFVPSGASVEQPRLSHLDRRG